MEVSPEGWPVLPTVSQVRGRQALYQEGQPLASSSLAVPLQALK